MYGVGCIICLLGIAILGGVTSLPEQLELENPTDNKDIRTILHDYNSESRARKCGKMRIACANAGGKCQSKTDVCEGKLLTGRIYCKNAKTCGCCVPPPPKGCIFGSTVYPHESFIEEACMNLQCVDGSWIYIVSSNIACGECQVFGEPHFITYEPHNISNRIITHYEYQGEGDYIISQQGLDIPDALFRVTSNFIECRAAGITCINSVNYIEPGIEVSFILPALEDTDRCRFSKDPASDPLCKIKVLVNSRERTIGNSVNSFYATDGTVLVFEHNHIGSDANLNCMNMVGSKGFSVSLCQHTWDYAYLYVWATPSLQGQLYGLCDTFSGNLDKYPTGYTAQNGSLIKKRAGISPTHFADSWKIGENPKSNKTLAPADKCENSKEKDKIAKECDKITKDACQFVDQRTCNAYISACIFDLCHVPNHDSYALGYASHMLVNSQVSVLWPSCECGYSGPYQVTGTTVDGGCYITEAASPNGLACRCDLHRDPWTGYFYCTGTGVACLDNLNSYCIMPDKSYPSCLQGQGNCNGYPR